MIEKQNRNNREQKQGIVVSDEKDKTVVSEVKKVKHRYEKSIVKKKNTGFMMKKTVSKNGDKVSIMEMRPINKKNVGAW